MNELINFKKFGDSERGYLSFFETHKDIPFEVQRIYYTYDVTVNVKRGLHAHKELKQILWCPYGKIEVVLDDGYKSKFFALDSPEKALLVGSGVWRDLYWRKEGSVLCVAASNYYDENDYIRDYEVFLDYVKEGYWDNENKL